MSKRNKTKKSTNLRPVEIVVEEMQPEKSNTLIFSGVLLALSSIGLLIFVLSEKVFHLK